ncbi:MAG: twin-arginine translocase TatA/TatE family subunit [Martelella sp.]|uniref:Sec-independent protein translocase protein TatA n=1 Tax=Martelella mediterranea DSM 17316 TaxID=1122214 RepID=A0A1U9Z2U7_9HYPH|nr:MULTISPECIES: twin-arginine translocase TatA/TatE family subunit [Martelella]AQZ52025.1 Sec-independent protein translocase protein TatA [Martelella mediterranea DSM 17316]MAU18965.1 twin-arginine translocase TatA/TatE family subunit [Martelella sp.]|tara:strand:+ start:621 stop:836 length:216 start_codon:yes stop_codon:yes gene_type:complete
MGNLGIWQLLIILAIVVLLFGRGKIPELMGDVAKGIKSFKKGISDDDEKPAEKDKTVEHTVDHRADETKQG